MAAEGMRIKIEIGASEKFCKTKSKVCSFLSYKIRHNPCLRNFY